MLHYKSDIMMIDYLIENKEKYISVYKKNELEYINCLLVLFDCMFQWNVFIHPCCNSDNKCKINYNTAVFLYKFIKYSMNKINLTKLNQKNIFKSLFSVYPHNLIFNDNILINYIINMKDITTYEPNKPDNNENDNLFTFNSTISKLLYDTSKPSYNINSYITDLPLNIFDYSSLPKLNTRLSDTSKMIYKYIIDLRLYIGLCFECLTFNYDNYEIWAGMTQAFNELFYCCVNYEMDLCIPENISNNDSNELLFDGFDDKLEENKKYKISYDYYLNHTIYCYETTQKLFENINNEIIRKHNINYGLFLYIITSKSFNVINDENIRIDYYKKALNLFNNNINKDKKEWDVLLFINKCKKKIQMTDYLSLYNDYYQLYLLIPNTNEKDRYLSYVLSYISNAGLNLIKDYLDKNGNEWMNNELFNDEEMKKFENIHIIKLINCKPVNTTCLECNEKYSSFSRKCELCGITYHDKCFHLSNNANDICKTYCKYCEKMRECIIIIFR